MSEKELKERLAALEAKLKSIPGWLLMILLTDEIRKIKDQLAEAQTLEHKD